MNDRPPPSKLARHQLSFTRAEYEALGLGQFKPTTLGEPANEPVDSPAPKPAVKEPAPLPTVKTRHATPKLPLPSASHAGKSAAASSITVAAAHSSHNRQKPCTRKRRADKASQPAISTSKQAAPISLVPPYTATRASTKPIATGAAVRALSTLLAGSSSSHAILKQYARSPSR